ncbi:Uncharacterized protein dnl_17620 [Desulfonema limicola]|uniref:Uncharacterized protein n=1 Tax=Desulfonema limicola TaxID=45656 RepID=A0A975B643_9BACT|nr:Uncharacterized protein dnl_17620 [Desulfonema limicola]
MGNFFHPFYFQLFIKLPFYIMMVILIKFLKLISWGLLFVKLSIFFFIKE